MAVACSHHRLPPITSAPQRERALSTTTAMPTKPPRKPTRDGARSKGNAADKEKVEIVEVVPGEKLTVDRQTMLNLNTEILGRLPLRLPPLGEQRKLAAILSSVESTNPNPNPRSQSRFLASLARSTASMQRATARAHLLDARGSDIFRLNEHRSHLTHL